MPGWTPKVEDLGIFQQSLAGASGIERCGEAQRPIPIGNSTGSNSIQ